MEETPESQPVLTEPITASDTSRNFKWKKWLLILLVVAAGLVLVGGGIFVYRKAMKRQAITSTSPALPETIQPEKETPPVTPTPALTRADIKIQVLNGSGTPGAAGKTADFLEDKGYEDIKTGNADSYDYEKTVVKIKEDKKDYLELLRSDLSGEYTLAADTETLETDSSFDAIIILGAS